MKTSPSASGIFSRADALDHRLHRELHRADEHRQAELALGDQLAGVAVVDAVGAVERLGDHRAERRAHERQVHLVADLLQAVLQHREGDGVERCGVAVVAEASGLEILAAVRPIDDQVADRVRPRPGSPGSITRRAVELLDDRRPVERGLRPAAARGRRPACRSSRRRTRPVRRSCAPPRRASPAASRRAMRRERDRLALADHRRVQVDQHRPDLRQLDAEALPVGRGEGGAQLSRRHDRGRGDRHRQDVALALELHVGAVQRNSIALDRDVLAREQSPGRRRSAPRRPRRRGRVEHFERLVDGARRSRGAGRRRRSRARW